MSRSEPEFKSLKACILQAIETSGPDSFVCPLSMEIMRDPVLTRDGHCYERAVIENWLQFNDTSPLSGMKLDDKTLVPVLVLRKCIEEWRETVVKHISLSHLSIREEIGRGETKTAYSALLDGQLVAVVDMFQKSRRQVFAKKILAWIKLPPHPRFMHLFGMSLDAAQELLVVELAPLGTLPEALLRIGTMPTPHKLVVLQQVCAGMEALVAAGSAHGHLALHAVFAFRYDAADAAATSVKLLNLSAADAAPARWAAPERLRAPPAPAAESSDVWSFGVLAWELLADGRRPYPAAADSQVAPRVLVGERPGRVAGCADALWSVVAGCWADRAADRPSFHRLAVALYTVAITTPHPPAGPAAGGWMPWWPASRPAARPAPPPSPVAPKRRHLAPVKPPPPGASDRRRAWRRGAGRNRRPRP